jgi:predicted membrane channel-forming protein YqfA (hemolysin III family)
MKKTLLIITAVTLSLIGTLLSVGRNWPPPENPPRQGEGIDVIALKSGIFIHSQLALSRMVREPQNTWSNLAFVVVGAYLVTGGLTRRARLVGAALIAVGIGSFLYHASASRTLRHADVAAMYALFFATSALCIGSLHRRIGDLLDRRIGVLAIGTLVIGVCATAGRNIIILGVKPFSLTVGTAAAATLLILSLVYTAYQRQRTRTTSMAAGAVGAFIIGVVCQVGDRPGGWLCAPDAVVQGHALWHLFSALAVFLAVRTLDQMANQTTKRTALAQPILVGDHLASRG